METSTVTGSPNSVNDKNSDLGPSGDASAMQEIQNNVGLFPLHQSMIQKSLMEFCGSNDTRGRIMQQVQILMQELEQKRETDKQLLEEFRVGMQGMVDEVCHQVEERLLEQHQETNKQMQVKLQYLNEIVDRVVDLESELCNFKQAVGCLFKDLHD